MKVTLQLSDGREMTFVEQELIAIVEKHFSNEATKQEQTTEVAKTEHEPKTYEVADTPTEGKVFKVNPLAIDQNLFKKKRKDIRQKVTRRIILKAFAELKKNPEKYGKNFKTMMPKKEWSTKTVAQLKEMACKLGDHNADWVEQALEWAQRIVNGDSWEAICNDMDTANWYRLVVWKNGYARLVGGSREGVFNVPASVVGNYDYYDNLNCRDTVPLVVIYE